MNKEFKIRVWLLLFNALVVYSILIGGGIYTTFNIKNSYTSILLCISACSLGIVLYTIGIIKAIFGKVLIDNDKIKILYKNIIINQIDLNNVMCISYHSLPIIKGIEMITIYEINKKPFYVDFGLKNYIEIYNYVIEYCKNNSNIIIDKKLLKRLDKIK